MWRKFLNPHKSDRKPQGRYEAVMTGSAARYWAVVAMRSNMSYKTGLFTPLGGSNVAFFAIDCGPGGSALCRLVRASESHRAFTAHWPAYVCQCGHLFYINLAPKFRRARLPQNIVWSSPAANQRWIKRIDTWTVLPNWSSWKYKLKRTNLTTRCAAAPDKQLWLEEAVFEMCYFRMDTHQWCCSFVTVQCLVNGNRYHNDQWSDPLPPYSIDVDGIAVGVYQTPTHSAHS